MNKSNEDYFGIVKVINLGSDIWEPTNRLRINFCPNKKGVLEQLFVSKATGKESWQLVESGYFPKK